MARQKSLKRAAKRSTARKKRSVFSYPSVIFLLLCAGVFLIAWTFRAGADNILVTAKVPGPPVTSPAVITSPDSGVHFNAIPINVSGSCPANAAYVEIFRNNLMSGTALCSGSGTFQLSTDLFPGQNNLVAHVFNVTDDEGPVSATVTVYYDIPQPPAGTPLPHSNPGQSASSASPLTLKTAFIYKGYYVGQQVEWPLQIDGGASPYAVNVDWGDGTNDVISRSQAGEFKFSHTYSQPGGYKGSYTVKIKASDSEGHTAYIQFFVIVNANKNSGLAGNIFNKPPPRLGGTNWLLIAWPAYLIVFVMAVSYLLGEREELIILRKRGLLKH